MTTEYAVIDSMTNYLETQRAFRQREKAGANSEYLILILGFHLHRLPMQLIIISTIILV